MPYVNSQRLPNPSLFPFSGARLPVVACLVMTLAGALQGQPCLPPPPGLVGWWPASGDAGDLAGTNHGTLWNGATASATGQVGSAFALDGVNDYVEIPDAPELKPTNVTVECWARFDALNTAGASDPGWLYLVFKKNSQSFNFEGYTLMKTRPPGLGKDVLSFLISARDHTYLQVNGTTAVVTGQWYHVAGSYDGATAKVYVNGVEEGSQPVSFALDYGTRPVFIGTSGESNWDGKLAGAVDEVSIYSRALSAGEIASAYAAGSAGKCPPGTVVWDGGGDGLNWTNALNWSGDAVPGAANTVIINLPGTNATIVINANATVGSVQCEESLAISNGTLTVTAGASRVNGGLTVISGRGLAARGSNTTFTASGPTVIDGASLTALNGASLDLPGASSFTSGWLTLSNNATASLAGLTNVDLTRFLLYAGANFTLPASVTNYSSSGGIGMNEQRTIMLAQGAGTRLDLSALQGFQAEFSGWGGLLMLVTAATGGEIDLSGVRTVTAGGRGVNGGGPLEFRTDATGLIRLTALTQLNGVNAGILFNCARTNFDLPQLTAAALTRFTLPANGLISAPALASLQTCRMTIPNGARLAASALGQFLNSTLELSGSGVFGHGTLATVESSRFLLSAGATYTLPSYLQSFVSSAAFAMNEQRILFSATGAGTRLDLSALTNIVGIFSASGGLLLRIQATSGGEVDLSGLRTVTGGGSGVNGGGPFEFYEDATSQLRLSALEHAAGTGAGLQFSLGATNELTAAQLTVTNTRIVLAANSLATVGTLVLFTDAELSGSGTIQGSVTNSGEVRPGTSAGRLTVDGDYTQTPTGTLFVEVGGANAATQYDQLAVTGNAVLDGTLNLQLINSYAPDLTNTFQILPCGSRVGQFASVSGTDAGKSVTFIPTYETNSVWLGLTFATGPSVVAAWPTGSVTDTFGQFTLTFSETLTSSSFTTADISLTGPAGAIAVNAPQLLSNTTWRITFAAQTLPGDYTLIVGPAVNDLVGNPMNQNGDGVNGQAIEDRFVRTVTVPAPVDFAALDLSAPSAAAVGTPVQISWTVMNQSTNPAAGPRTDAVYLSTDRVVGSDVSAGPVHLRWRAGRRRVARGDQPGGVADGHHRHALLYCDGRQSA